MKKILCSLLVLLLCGCSTSNTYSESANEDFNLFLDETYTQQMELDLLTVYFSLNDYEAYGIEKPEVTLGEVSYTIEDQELLEDLLDELESFEYEQLDESQQRIYDNLAFDINLSLDRMQYEDLSFLFRPSTGITSSLSTLFTEYKMKNTERVEDYLVLLQDIDRLLDDALTLSVQQAEAGYFLSDTTIDATIESIDRFVAKQEDHAFITTFNDRIDEVDFLSEEEKEDYKLINQQIVLEEVIPSYQKVKETLEALKGLSSVQTGISDYPNGQAYYENIVYSQSGSMQTVDELYEDAFEYVQNLIFSVQLLAKNQPEAYNEFINYTFVAQDPTAIVDQLVEESSVYFNPGPSIYYEVSYLDEGVASDGISAYYLIPEIDLLEENVIRINAAYNEEDPAGMYLTLAHEGYPGHMYQNTYFLSLDPHPIYSLFSFIGYSEGWAMYSSLFAYDYLDFENTATSELFKFDVRLGYVVSMIMDIGVNYYGYDVLELQEELYDLGLDYSGQLTILEDAMQNVIDEPGQIIPYGAGLMQFDNYLMEVKSELEEDFDYLDYHQMLIENGPQSFDHLAEDVQQYIEEN
ncbi:MAG: DUF885 family protein [Erysipelotrichaceae bacterium]